MKNKSLIIIISNDALDESGNPIFLRAISGKSIIHIMAERLASINSMGHAILYMRRYDKGTALEAERFGWQVIHKRSKYLQLLHPLYLLFKYWGSAVFNLTYPFIDKERCESLFSMFHRENIGVMRINNGSEFTPQYLIKNSFALLGIILKFIKREGFQKLLRDIVPEACYIVETVDK